MVFEATGETGVVPVGGELVAVPLMMPMTRLTGRWAVQSNITMQNKNANTSGDDDNSHADRVRSQMNTTDLGAIMGRFYDAVSWRNN